MALNIKSLACVLGVIVLKLLLPAQAQLDLSKLGSLQVAGEKQYFIANTLQVNFHKALQYCAMINMTLASIETATEHQNLKNILLMNSGLSRQYWLSGTDLPLSRQFVWFGTGSLLSFTSWASGVRSNNNQRCIRTDESFNWRRESCSNAKYFICERPVLPVCGNEGCDKHEFLIY